jgi:hypothetical protein
MHRRTPLLNRSRQINHKYVFIHEGLFSAEIFNSFSVQDTSRFRYTGVLSSSLYTSHFMDIDFVRKLPEGRNARTRAHKGNIIRLHSSELMKISS